MNSPHLTPFGWILAVVGSLAVSLLHRCEADVPVSFRNGTQEVPALVYLPDSVAAGHPSVMLLYSLSTNLPLSWRIAGSANLSRTVPGVFIGGRVNLPDVAPGQHVSLSVAISGFPLYTSLIPGESVSIGPGAWRCGAFDYVFDPTKAEGAAMVNFPGLYAPFACSLRAQLPPASVTCDEGSSVVLLPDIPNINAPRDFGVYLGHSRIPNVPSELNLGSLPEFNTSRNGILYTPRPNTYGTDLVYQEVGGGICDPPSDIATPLTIHIRPSPLRPYLAIASTSNHVSVKLRGLIGMQHVIQRSTNLRDWSVHARMTGNNSELDVPNVLTPGESTVYLRLSE